REEHYAYNVKHLRWINYLEDGRLIKEVTYKNITLYCPYKEYYDSGIIKLSGNYTGGKKTGDWKYTNEAGKLEKTEHYKNDVLVKTKVVGEK
ncbi:MAG: rane-binding protein, partial [Chitinophagaceae bacterium]|nr:rane-binding protein [Chitinophagaceae bacterium]